MRTARVWKTLLGVERAVIEQVTIEDDDTSVLVAKVRPTRAQQSRCSRCGRKCRGYDRGAGPRRWRTLDLGATMAYLEADAPRVRCPTHGVVVAAVPWARPEARFTRAFEDLCAWLASRTASSTVAELLRVTWRSVTGIVARVVADAAGRKDRLEGLRRIGIDEMAHRKGQRYITIVVDHDTGQVVWAAEGRNEATLEQFFDALGDKRAGLLTHVSADGAEWIHNVVGRRAPQAIVGLDPFHVVAVRREAPCARRRVRDPPLRAVAAAR